MQQVELNGPSSIGRGKLGIASSCQYGNSFGLCHALSRFFGRPDALPPAGRHETFKAQDGAEIREPGFVAAAGGVVRAVLVGLPT
jgi:hypothetical protein